jgi:hypothetical protein
MNDLPQQTLELVYEDLPQQKNMSGDFTSFMVL